MCHWKNGAAEVPRTQEDKPWHPIVSVVMDPLIKSRAVAQATVPDGCQFPSNHSATGSSTVPPSGLEHARL